MRVNLLRETESRWLWAIIALAVVLRLGAALYMGNRVEVLPGIHDQFCHGVLVWGLICEI